MYSIRSALLASVVATCNLACASPALAQGYGSSWNRSDDERDQSWYSQQVAEDLPSPRQLIFHKAQARAAQRNARMTSMAWYGMSNARPTAAPTPFMTLYSPVWQQPGGRPFAWYTANWPTYAYITR